MALKTLTAANSVFMLAIPGLYPIPQRIEGFATDDALSMEAVASAEVVKGVDGRSSGAWIPALFPQKIMLQADSPSLQIFENWAQAQITAREVMSANATIAIPAIGRKYNMTTGYLTKSTPMVSIKKTLQPGEYEITWDNITGADA